MIEEDEQEVGSLDYVNNGDASIGDTPIAAGCEKCGKMDFEGIRSEGKCRECFEADVMLQLRYVPSRFDLLLKSIAGSKKIFLTIITWLLITNIVISMFTWYNSTCTQQIRWMTVSFYIHLLGILFVFVFGIALLKSSFGVGMYFLGPPFACFAYFIHFWVFGVPFSNKDCDTASRSAAATQIVLVLIDVICVIWGLCDLRTRWVAAKQQVQEPDVQNAPKELEMLI
eukprot:TRINITY_DN7895_c1_g1_i1.p1 TRINITY_DN7895_c1_g1~~TRINITY_DN7895_c1_g1_i1.p1  ORF type:complete len:243 (+),score=28.18 TRINITY_DN7895_c1_g1_i1:49-729(+)